MAAHVVLTSYVERRIGRLVGHFLSDPHAVTIGALGPQLEPENWRSAPLTKQLLSYLHGGFQIPFEPIVQDMFCSHLNEGADFAPRDLFTNTSYKELQPNFVELLDLYLERGSTEPSEAGAAFPELYDYAPLVSEPLCIAAKLKVGNPGTLKKKKKDFSKSFSNSFSNANSRESCKSISASIFCKCARKAI